MGWLISLFTGGLGTVLEKLAGIFGKTLVDLKNTEANRQANENNNGAQVAGQWMTAQNNAAATRADVQKSKAWGPFDIAALVIGLFIAYHVGWVVSDSISWYPTLTTKFYVLPWIEWVWHKPGSWNVAALPSPFDATEHEILKALFYVGPPSAAAVVVAKVFRR
jgi:hypothetical protein